MKEDSDLSFQPLLIKATNPNKTTTTIIKYIQKQKKNQTFIVLFQSSLLFCHWFPQSERLTVSLRNFDIIVQAHLRDIVGSIADHHNKAFVHCLC